MDAPSSHSHRDLVAATRQTAGSAAIGAALLLFFGFYTSEPSGNELFAKSAWLMVRMLRIGGVATAVMAIWLWTGNRVALAVDACVAAVIGSIFILTGAGMLIDNGSLVQVVINVVCGLLFIRAAVLSAALYRHPAWRLAVEPPNSPRAQLPANELVGNPVPERSSPSSPSPTAALDIPSGAAEPPPEGYLASFAKKRET